MEEHVIGSDEAIGSIPISGSNKNKMNNLKPEDKICHNCKHLLRMIAIGQGLRCGHPSEKGSRIFPPIIPKKTHTCGLFEYRETPSREGSKK